MASPGQVAPLEPNECFDAVLKKPIRFASSSDALFASLTLTHRLPYEGLDRILIVLRDPSFNLEDLSFRNTSDILLAVSRRRLEEVQLRETRCDDSRDTGLPLRGIGIPLVILNLVIDLFRDELYGLRRADRQTRNGVGSSLPSLNDRQEDIRVAMKNLSNVSLVHPSWVLPARRALGAYLVSYKSLAAPLIRNPCLGAWTREAHFSMYGEQPCEHVLALFTKLSRLRFLQIDTSGVKQKHLITRGLSLILSRLHDLEEVVLDAGSRFPTYLLTHLANVTRPSFTKIRFAQVSILERMAPVLSPKIELHALTTIASLRFIQLHSAHGPHYCITWTREDSESSTESRFVVDTLYTRAREKEFDDREKRVLAVIRRLHLRVFEDGDKKQIAHILRACPSLRHLIINTRDFNTVAFTQLQEAPATLETLVVSLTHPIGVYSDDTASLNEGPDAWDQRVYAVLSLPNRGILRSLRVCLTPLKDIHISRLRVQGHDGWIETYNEPWPKCKEFCTERGILFEFEIREESVFFNDG